MPGTRGPVVPGMLTPYYHVGWAPESVRSADVDGDGAPDLITANSRDDTVSVLRNLGDGTFEASVPYPVSRRPRSVASAYVDDDATWWWGPEGIPFLSEQERQSLLGGAPGSRTSSEERCKELDRLAHGAPPRPPSLLAVATCLRPGVKSPL